MGVIDGRLPLALNVLAFLYSPMDLWLEVLRVTSTEAELLMRSLGYMPDNMTKIPQLQALSI